MSESMSSASTAVQDHAPKPAPKLTIEKDQSKDRSLEIPLEDIQSPTSPQMEVHTDSRRQSLDLDDYFHGPRDLTRHSRWPLFMRLHGSILPKMVLPLIFVGAWATAVTVVSKKVHDLSVDSVLLTLTGFVVSLGLSFRSSSAYERYAEGRRYFSLLILASQTLGRVFWVHARDPPNQDRKEVTLKKLGAMNLVVAFAVSLKHSLRFEPFTAYPDIQYLVGHLDTFARAATEDAQDELQRNKGFFKKTGESLGVSFATSNPRKLLKRTSRPLGNMPLEILNYLAVTVDHMVENDQLPVGMQQTLAYNNLAVLNDVMVGCERVRNTPLPIAYSIAIHQITWLYVIVMPFQLISLLSWVAIPASILASSIILALLAIGFELEDPFGHDVNDLPLDTYCEQIASDMDVIATYDKTGGDAFLVAQRNRPLYPLSTAPIDIWMKRDEGQLQEAIRRKPHAAFERRHTDKDMVSKTPKEAPQSGSMV